MEISSRWYERRSMVDIEEDEYNEFKGHRSICIEDLPPWCYQPGNKRRSRKAISRALAAFLNSARGGKLYMGIIDEGVVKGLYLTEYQQDHVTISIKDLFSRYKPPVSEEMYKIEFIPVFGREEAKIIEERDVDALQKEDIENHMKSHLLRTFDFCWCDKDLARRIDEGVIPRDYVIEVTIYPQKVSFAHRKDGDFKAELPVVYQNEEGKCFFRKSASCVEYTIDEMRELAMQSLKQLYLPVIKSLRNELSQLEKGVT